MTPSLREALADLCRHFPTDTDMLEAGWLPSEVEAACNAYDRARRCLEAGPVETPSVHQGAEVAGAVQRPVDEVWFIAQAVGLRTANVLLDRDRRIAFFHTGTAAMRAIDEMALDEGYTAMLLTLPPTGRSTADPERRDQVKQSIGDP